MKFQASSSFLRLHRPVYVGPGRKPRRPVFSRHGSYHLLPFFYLFTFTYKPCHEIFFFFACVKTRTQISSCIYCTAGQHFCFHFIVQSFLNFKLLACFYDCRGRFVSELVGIPEDQFSHVPAHIYMNKDHILQILMQGNHCGAWMSY